MKTEHARLCGTAISRLWLEAQIYKLATRYHWDVVSRSGLMDRAIMLTCNKPPYAVSMDFDGKSHVGAFLAHWHGDTEYPHDFNLVIRGSINTIHWCKATICDDTFKEFLISLEGGFQRLEGLTSLVD